jgi:hypothetical protein
MEKLIKEILDKTNRYNRNKNNRWFKEKFDELVELLPFKVETFNEVLFVVNNDLKKWSTCKVCGNNVKKLEKVYCSTKCSANDPENKQKRISTLKKTNKENPHIIEKRTRVRKETIAKKSDEEMKIWRDRMSIASKKKEENMSVETKKKRSQKLSSSLKNYFDNISDIEMQTRVESIRFGRIKNDSFTKISKTMREVYSQFKDEIEKKKYQTRIKNGNTSKENHDYSMYVRLVRYFSEHTYIEFYDDINPNNEKRGKYSNKNLYHLDHIVSIKDGFDNNIPIHIMSSKYNLQMLLVEKNCSKSRNSGMEIEMLLKHF